MMNITNGVNMTVKPTEGFVFNSFDTTKNNMFLVSRSAPTPSEKEIIENVAFMNGVHDFSMMLGERVFDNRPITYNFQLPKREYMNRKVLQTSLENKLMVGGIQQLHDTHDPNYYYLGKCVSVETEDDHEYGRLIVSVEFDCYPFKIAKLPEGNDIWDSFNFELDVSQPVAYEVSGELEINLLNVGSTSVVPTVTASNAMEVRKGNSVFNIPSGQSKSELLRLDVGENHLTVIGNGTIEFSFHKELI